MADAEARFVVANHTLRVPTRGVEITEGPRRWLDSLSVGDGLFTLFICHTSASLTIQENADPKVRVDLLAALEALAPEAGHAEERSYAEQHQVDVDEREPLYSRSMRVLGNC
jgi:thiamine phosphate synthase YjbQ (UPF0047 family)